jgi:hypothetical protein
LNDRQDDENDDEGVLEAGEQLEQPMRRFLAGDARASALSPK